MALTTEKAEKLVNYLAEDEKRAESLMALEASEALAKLSEAGIDVTAEDLSEFAKQLEKVSASQESGELSEDALEDVAGGINWRSIIAPIFGPLKPRPIFPRRW